MRRRLLPLLKESLHGQITKSEAGYEPDADDDQCKDCVYYESTETCDRVKGIIDPEATCNLFEEN
jgi:hypothetical protein